jgi:hypothetical protein
MGILESDDYWDPEVELAHWLTRAPQGAL